MGVSQANRPTIFEAHPCARRVASGWGVQSGIIVRLRIFRTALSFDPRAVFTGYSRSDIPSPRGRPDFAPAAACRTGSSPGHRDHEAPQAGRRTLESPCRSVRSSRTTGAGRRPTVFGCACVRAPAAGSSTAGGPRDELASPPKQPSLLPSRNRMKSARDFQSAIRGGRRSAAETLVAHYLPGGPVEQPPRVGLAVSKSVGNSVVRHRVARRLRHAVAARMSSLPPGSLLVLRAKPAASSASSSQLSADMDRALARALGASR